MNSPAGLADQPLSLYRPDIATMESGESIYNQDDVTGFIGEVVIRNP